MNWLLYIGGFPIFFTVSLCLIARCVPGGKGFEIQGTTMWIITISHLLVWIWICMRFIK